MRLSSLHKRTGLHADALFASARRPGLTVARRGAPLSNPVTVTPPAVSRPRTLLPLATGVSTGVSTRPRAKPVSAAASLLWLSSTTGRPVFNASSASR